MPQLDVGIFFVEFFLNFICFWFLYFYKAKNIFPFLNKTIKLRKYKLKKIDIFLNLYLLKYKFLNNFFIYNFIDSFFFKSLFFFNLKINFIFFIFLKKLYIKFLLKKKNFIYNFLNELIFLNIIN